MLKLKDIKKDYVTGDSVVHALKGVSLEFRKSEFVSILGQSGCGKTTLLNIIGGLDQYTSGDLIINGKSTKEYGDRDWDTYRNHSVGFIFQSYNLIPHQTVLANVELALTLSGVSKEERRKRATEALITVGLGEQIKKRPNQLSGGQMQRVAIARALVNDPDILLADEPTGALDSETSVQIMELLKAISNDKLIIMVTHNPDLAKEYSSRIINLLDGNVISDSDPYTAPCEGGCGEGRISAKAFKISSRREIKAIELQSKAILSGLKSSNKEAVPQKKEELDGLIAKKKAEADEHYRELLAIEAEKKRLAKEKALKEKEELKSLPEGERAKRLEEIKAARALEKQRRKEQRLAERKTSMSFLTALSLSLNNLMTKKGRTFLTSFAGSIGIIGIALILSVSSGVNSYITSIEESTMSSYPLQINESSMDTMSVMTTLMSSTGVENPKPGTIYSNDIMANVMNAITSGFTKNNLTSFKDFIEGSNDIRDNSTDIKYVYAANLNTYRIVGGIEKYRATLDGIGGLLQDIGLGDMFGMSENSSSMLGGSKGAFTELVGDKKEGYLESQYDTLYGRFPKNDNEVVLIVGENQQISDFILYTLGIRDTVDLEKYIQSRLDKDPKNDYTIPAKQYTFKEICGYKFKVLPDSEKYKLEGDRIVERSPEEINSYLDSNKAITLEIVGIVTPSEDSGLGAGIGAIGYTSDLMDKIIEQSNSNELIKLQKENTEKDMLNGIPYAGFSPNTEYITHFIKSNTEQMGDLTAYLDMSPVQLLQSLRDIVMTDPSAKKLLSFEWDGGLAPYGGYTLADIDTKILPAINSINNNQIKGFAMMLYQLSISGSPEYDKEGNITGTVGADPTKSNFIKVINTMLTDNGSYTAEQAHLNTLNRLGYVDFDKPTSILIYPKDFAAKDVIKTAIEDYNNKQDKDNKITYTDTVAMLMESVTTIVNAISYVLIAFVAISLIVSSIMIGIITYISVLERTKEIGILRAIGASKKDISRVFNAETLIVGFAAGALGILISLFLIVIINAILLALTGIEALQAVLPWGAAIILVLISMGLTLIAGLFPARMASKKDPVIALRTE